MQPSISQETVRLASAAQEMARRSDLADGKVFSRVAMVCMGVTAVASIAQVFYSLLRDLNRKEHKERGR